MPKKAPILAEVKQVVYKKTMLDRLLIAIFWIGRFIRRRWLILLILGICLLPVIGIAVFLMKPEEPEIIVDNAKKGILIQAVEAVGAVISEKDLELKFPVTGVVSEVNVNEGDTVEAGKILAALRCKNVSQAEVNSAAANVQSAQANLQALEEGTRPEEIAIAEAEVANRKASLDLAKTSLSTAEANLNKAQEKLNLVIKEAETNLAGDISSAGSVISQNATKAQSAINAIEDIYNKTIVRNALEFYSLIETEKVRIKQEEAKKLVTDLLLKPSSQNFDETFIQLTNAKTALLSASNFAVIAYNTLSNTSPSSYFTETVKETYKANITTERNNIETALNAVTAELESFRNASDGYRTSISTQEVAVTSSSGLRDKALSDISTYETLLKTQEAQLALKKAGARDTDIKSAKAKVNQAYADLQRANAKLEDTILRAPIDGRITNVGVQTGEFSGDSRSITMLGNSPFRIELFVSEIDITKVKITQSGAIELDAYPNQDFWLTVTEIDPAATMVDGVPKYRIKLDFIENTEELFKIGMTGDTDIITGVRYDVIYIPGRAVISNADGEDIVRILKEDGSIEERPVVVGMETETDSEIIEGVSEGETVVVLIKN